MTLQMELRWQYDGNTMAQASTLVPVTKMKKAQAWTLAISWGKDILEYQYVNNVSNSCGQETRAIVGG